MLHFILLRSPICKILNIYTEERWGQLAEQSAVSSSVVQSTRLSWEVSVTRSVACVSRWQLMRLRRPILPIFTSLSNGSSISANMSSVVAAGRITHRGWQLRFVSPPSCNESRGNPTKFSPALLYIKIYYFKIQNIQLHFKYHSELSHSSTFT